MLSKIFIQIKTELKHNFIPLILANFIIIGIAYFIFGLENLNLNTKGMIVERFLPLIGIFSIVSIFYAEEKSPIKDILIMRNTSLEFIYTLRFLIRFGFYLLTSLIYISLLNRGTIDSTSRILFHSISIAAFIGGIGILLYSFTNNIALAFLTSLGFIILQWFMPKNQANILSLFTMPEISVRKIAVLLAIFLVHIVLAMEIWKRNSIS